MRGRWRWSLAGVLGLAVAVSLFVIPALGQGEVIAESGLLRLQLDGGGDRFVFDPTTGPDQVQVLSQANCKLSSSGVSLVSVVGSSANAAKKPYAGLKDHRIGVGQNGEGNGEPCARINKDLGQTLTLSLTGGLAGEAIGYAEIDLGFKFNGDAVLELRKGGVLVDTVTVPCGGQSDCGPDSGGSDNERVILWVDPGDDPGDGHWQDFQIDGVFDTILIRPGSASSSGAISLEAGLNGSPSGPLGTSLHTADTLFSVVEVFDGEIDCETTVVLGGGDDPTMQITRGNDTDGGCKGPVDGLLFNFDAGVDAGRKFVDFVTEPVDANPSTVAQFLEVITWTFADPPNVVGGAAQQRTLYYDDHVTGVPERVMPWCLKDPRPIGPGTTGVLPSGHTSCLIEANSQVTMAGDFETTHTIYNIGDGKRGF